MSGVFLLFEWVDIRWVFFFFLLLSSSKPTYWIDVLKRVSTNRSAKRITSLLQSAHPTAEGECERASKQKSSTTEYILFPSSCIESIQIHSICITLGAITAIRLGISGQKFHSAPSQMPPCTRSSVFVQNYFSLYRIIPIVNQVVLTWILNMQPIYKYSFKCAPETSCITCSHLLFDINWVIVQLIDFLGKSRSANVASHTIYAIVNVQTGRLVQHRSRSSCCRCCCRCWGKKTALQWQVFVTPLLHFHSARIHIYLFDNCRISLTKVGISFYRLLGFQLVVIIQRQTSMKNHTIFFFRSPFRVTGASHCYQWNGFMIVHRI